MKRLLPLVRKTQLVENLLVPPRQCRQTVFGSFEVSTNYAFNLFSQIDTNAPFAGYPGKPPPPLQWQGWDFETAAACFGGQELAGLKQ